MSEINLDDDDHDCINMCKNLYSISVSKKNVDLTYFTGVYFSTDVHVW